MRGGWRGIIDRLFAYITRTGSNNGTELCCDPIDIEDTVGIHQGLVIELAFVILIKGGKESDTGRGDIHVGSWQRFGIGSIRVGKKFARTGRQKSTYHPPCQQEEHEKTTHLADQTFAGHVGVVVFLVLLGALRLIILSLSLARPLALVL